MTQFDFGNIDPNTTSGVDLANILESDRDAMHTNHKGPVRPSYVVPGMLWIKDGISPLEVNFFDGTNDLIMGTIDDITHIFKPFDEGAALAIVARTGLFSDIIGAPAGGLIFITGSDTTSGVLDDKFKLGAGFSRTINNPGANEEFQIEHAFASQAEAEAGSDSTKPMTSQRVAQAIAVQGTPPGVVEDYAGLSIPTGYVECDGAAISRTTFAALFTAIGTLWGIGDGSTTFNVPNLQRLVTMGSGGAGSSEIGNAVGDLGGTETHTLASSEVPATPISFQNAFLRSGRSHGVGGDQTYMSNAGSAQTVTVAGGGGSHNNVQPAAIMLKIIKT